MKQKKEATKFKKKQTQIILSKEYAQVGKLWNKKGSESVSCSVLPDYLWPHGLQPTRLLCSWDFPGKDTGVDCHFLLQGIFATQGWNWVSCAAGRFFTDWATREVTVIKVRTVTVPGKGRWYDRDGSYEQLRTLATFHFLTWMVKPVSAL